MKPLEPISPKDGTCRVSECCKEEDVISLVSQSLGLLNSETEGMMSLPIYNNGGTIPHNEMQSQEQLKKALSNHDLEVGMHVIQLKSGDTLMDEHNPRPCFFVVLSGCLKISITEEKKVLFSSKSGQGSGSDTTSSTSTGHLPANHVYSYGPGSMIGLAALLMGVTSTVYYSPDGSSTPMLSIQADGPTSVVRMSATTHDILISKYPVIVEHVAQSLIQRLPKVCDGVFCFVIQSNHNPPP